MSDSDGEYERKSSLDTEMIAQPADCSQTNGLYRSHGCIVENDCLLIQVV
jgi:hypothetical protein